MGDVTEDGLEFFPRFSSAAELRLADSWPSLRPSVLSVTDVCL